MKYFLIIILSVLCLVVNSNATDITTQYIDTSFNLSDNDSTIINKSPKSDSLPIWTFTVTAAIDYTTALCAGGIDSAFIKISAQMDSVNTRFNDPQVFNGIINFSLDSVFEFQDTLPPFNTTSSDYLLQYYWHEPHIGMYWQDPFFTIQLGWSFFDEGGAFGQRSTDILTHEFGHTRGALDVYWEYVPSENNPINGAEYPLDSTIMGSTYYGRIWDEQSIGFINRNLDSVAYDMIKYADYFQDSMMVFVTSSDSIPISDVLIKIYPVRSRTFEVYSSAIIQAHTNNEGKLLFQINPFEPMGILYPPYIKNCNLFVTAQKGSSFEYAWMPLSKVQAAYFFDSTKSYILNLVMEDIVLSIDDDFLTLPNSIQLEQNYPNPFNPTTSISFSLSNKSAISLIIYNTTGQVVRNLINDEYPAGTHIILWDGKNESGQFVSSGLYFYQLSTEDMVESKKMILLK